MPFTILPLHKLIGKTISSITTLERCTPVPDDMHGVTIHFTDGSVLQIGDDEPSDDGESYAYSFPVIYAIQESTNG